MTVLQLAIYTFVIWFGMYLLRRNPTKDGLRYTALGLIAYAVALGLHTLAAFSEAVPLIRWRDAFLFMPAAFWTGAIFNLLPKQPVNRLFNLSFYVVAGGLALLRFAPRSLAGFMPFIAMGYLLLAFLWALLSLRDTTPRRPLVVAITATLFFGLGLGAVILPDGFLGLSEATWVLAISVDFVLLGVAVGVLDAYDEGENLWRDTLRSLAETAFLSVILSAQLLMIARISDMQGIVLVVLHLVLLPTVFVLFMFYRYLQSGLDRVIYPNADATRAELANLRATAEAIPRRANTHDLLKMDEREFTRLTRRALSNMGDLSKLASSPLVDLPIVQQHLNGDDSTLHRANVLRDILAASIEQLKPPGDDDFGTSDAWRYYNALYFPYVAGLKPYSRRNSFDDLSAHEREAQAWFQAQVPERTLYNWQNKGAALIAVHLREQQG